MSSPFAVPKHLRFDDDGADDDLTCISHFKASSPARSLNTDTLHTALGLAGFKDALLESLVQEINNVWTLIGLWSRTDILETTLKGIDPSLAARPIQLAAVVSYLVLVGQFFDYGGSFDDAIPKWMELGAFVDLFRIPQGYSDPNVVSPSRSPSGSSSSCTSALFVDSEEKIPDGDSLIKVLEKNAWDSEPESCPMWAEETEANLGLVPDFMEVILNKDKAKEDPVRSEIAYSALLTAVKKSDAYSSLQQLKKQGQNSGFALWKELQETLSGEDRKAYNRKLLSKKLGDTWKTQSVSLLAYKGEMEEVFWLAKAAGENWDEPHWMEEFLNHFDDPEWKSYVSERARDVRHKKITTVAALYSDLSGQEHQMDAQSTRARDTLPTAARCTTSDKAASGLTSRQSIGTKNIDWAQMGLPSALWKDLGDRSRVFFLQWKDALIKNGGTSLSSIL
jgi:hypothetical protein